jgi:NAD(P)-dependent dehydrogenase (short-subunit alcohol dehydrogenase family)
MGANLDSAFFLLRAAAPDLKASGWGSVVLVSSISGEREANYSASKGGLNALARTAARELGRFGIRVDVIAPGWIETPMTAGLPAELRQRALEGSVLGRLGQRRTWPGKPRQGLPDRDGGVVPAEPAPAKRAVRRAGRGSPFLGLGPLAALVDPELDAHRMSGGRAFRGTTVPARPTGPAA